MAQQQTDIITEARANLANIDKEIEAAREQIHTLQAKVENLQRTKAQDEALIRIVDMHAQGKDLTALLNAGSGRQQARGERSTQPRTVREGGSRALRGNAVAILEAARELLEKEGSAGIKDIVQYVAGKDVPITGKDDAARQRNVYLTLSKDGSGFQKDRGLFSLAE